METIAVETGPCDLYHALGSVPSSDSSRKDATLLCVASSACSCEAAPSANEAHDITAAGSSCGADAPAWLSATVTCTLDVLIQVHPSLSRGRFADLLGGCHGVTVRKSEPHFARLTCCNARGLCELPDGLITLPLSPADVVATDVSTCSTRVKAATFSSAWSGQSARGRSAQSSTVGGTGGLPMETAIASAAEANCCSADAVCCAPEYLAILSEMRSTRVARSLPTVALLVRFPQRCRRALVLLRPSVSRRHKKYRVSYHASLRVVSESVQRVALMPMGDAAVLLADAFVHDAALSACASTGDSGASATLVLRGSYLSLDDGEQQSGALQPLLLHLGLRGAPARQRVLRSLLRCRVTGAWYRLRFPARGASRAPCCRPVVSELVLYTSEGHMLVFGPFMTDGAHEALTLAGKEDPSMTVVYTCRVGTRLLFSKLDASAAAESIAVSQPRDYVCGGALLVAPPWGFADRWRHSPWIERALALATTPSVAVSGVLVSGEGSRRRRRHRPSSVLAMSPNRGVWLLRTDSHLCVASVPTGTGAVGEHGDAEPTLISAVKLNSSHALHDAQYVACGGHAGFLLLCRHRSVGAAEPWDMTSAMSPVTVTSAVGDRFVYCSRSQSPLQLLFLSLTAMGTTAAAAFDAAISPLLPVPLISSSILASLPPSFAHPSSRLRLVCAVSAADTPDSMVASENLSDTLYVAISSSGDARCAWTATVRLPSVWPSCTSLFQLCPNECSGVAGGAGTATGRACQAASTLQWTAHALSALFPHACLMAGGNEVSMWRAAVQGTTASSLGKASPSAVASEEESPLETALEAVLLEVNYPYKHGTTSAAAAAALDVALGRGPHADGAALYYPAATVAFHDALHALLHACFCGEAASTAGAVAVVAGFSAALRMSGLLAGCRDCPDARGGGVVATRRMVAFLHGCAQLLLHAMEDVAAVGNVSALQACASHLAQTVEVGAARRTSSATTATAWKVWSLLLQPLFDFVWGVVQAYGVSAEVAAGLLEYCSPAVRSMVHARRHWWPDAGNAVHGRNPGNAAPLNVPEETPRTTGLAAHAVSAGLSAQHDGAAPPSEQHTSVPTAMSVSPAAAATASASSYTSAELYELVRRVFLAEGASAALGLLGELQRHDSTKAGMADMAQMLEAMQRRLQGAAV
ncbi:conserved hypothetical protein [Leishmania major strain Friedlin]|uniref:Uncharacterized protein n=1 Tax=Leishmania major TaxID=5664 RepID=Q4Q9E0_LEIMA|nr:conserved hypothetical protein [Leishmania major strain Friedlin]CAG9576334.1 hypothetical_protein_-_conserved [Leishmania major strain Friedlin]CAJ04768.1 conserved hypothetical protein [Leishmania major strain Friedlin]|eukprot:XP_001684058.1 conserved hypothetical protein [Leishmania major strain Friedlin]